MNDNNIRIDRRHLDQCVEVLDSGGRRECETGAARNTADDKGRCDLLPYEELARVVAGGRGYDVVLYSIGRYVKTGDTEFLAGAIQTFAEKREWDICTAMLEASMQYAAGAEKWGERNWEKGMPLHWYIDSGTRHYLQWLRGDTDERHDRAVLWNLLCAMWTHNHRPEMIDLPFKEAAQNENH